MIVRPLKSESVYAEVISLRPGGVHMIDKHCRYAALTGCRPRTVQVKARILRAFDRRAPILTATRSDVIGWIDRDLSAQTRSNYLAHLRGFYAWAAVEDLREDDPTRGIRTPKIPRRFPRPMPDADLARAIAAAPNPIRTWLILAAYAGLRGCEIAMMRGEDIDWSARKIHVPEGKGGAVGWVPLHPIVDDALRDWPRRGPLWAAHYTHVTARTNTFLHSLGIESTLHTARHWFGTNVLETSGGNVRVAQECLRHESIASTMVYTQITSSARSSAVELLRVG